MSPFYRLGARIARMVLRQSRAWMRQLAAAALLALVRRRRRLPTISAFVILGDRTGDAQPGVYERVWREMDALDPDFVINVGDTIQGGNDATAAPSGARYVRCGTAISYRSTSRPAITTSGRPRRGRSMKSRPGIRRFMASITRTPISLCLTTARPRFKRGPERASRCDFSRAIWRPKPGSRSKFVFFHKPFWLIPVKFQSSQFPFHQLDEEIRRAICGERSRAPVPAIVGRWHCVYRSGKFRREAEGSRF